MKNLHSIMMVCVVVIVVVFYSVNIIDDCIEEKKCQKFCGYDSYFFSSGTISAATCQCKQTTIYKNQEEMKT